MEPALVLAAWPLPGPWTTRPVFAGANAHTWYATSPAGAFVLRVSIGRVDPRRLDAEHRLLRRLAGTDLPFSVPTPVVTWSGSTVAPVEGAGERLATLVPVIVGVKLDAANLRHIAACGAALRALHAALARAARSGAASEEERGGPWGSGEPLLAEGDAWTEPHGLPDELRVPTAALVDTARRALAGMPTTVPTQLLHGDYDASNVLLVDGRVSGVLDFEFAAVGPRALDVANGLWSFALAGREERSPWPAVKAFLRGYCEGGRMSHGEAAALPDLVLAREARSLLRWAGRLRRGTTSQADLERRAQTALRLADWIHVNRDRLVRIGTESAWPPFG